MRGLDKDERYVLDVIARRDYDSPIGSEAAIERLRAQRLFRAVLEKCDNCEDIHELPVLTPEGKLAIAYDEAARNLT